MVVMAAMVAQQGQQRLDRHERDLTKQRRFRLLLAGQEQPSRATVAIAAVRVVAVQVAVDWIQQTSPVTAVWVGEC